MAAFGSSVINKSSKKLAPKPPPSRPRPVASVPYHGPSQASSSASNLPQPQQPIESDLHLKVTERDAADGQRLLHRDSLVVNLPAQPPVQSDKENQPDPATATQHITIPPDEDASKVGEYVEPPAKRRKIGSRSLNVPVARSVETLPPARSGSPLEVRAAPLSDNLQAHPGAAVLEQETHDSVPSPHTKNLTSAIHFLDQAIAKPSALGAIEGGAGAREDTSNDSSKASLDGLGTSSTALLNAPRLGEPVDERLETTAFHATHVFDPDAGPRVVQHEAPETETAGSTTRNNSKRQQSANEATKGFSKGARTATIQNGTTIMKATTRRLSGTRGKQVTRDLSTRKGAAARTSNLLRADALGTATATGDIASGAGRNGRKGKTTRRAICSGNLTSQDQSQDVRNAEEDGETQNSVSKRRVYRKSRAVNKESNDAAQSDGEPSAELSKRKGRRRRQSTPEEDEGHTIDPQRVALWELCRDTRKGKKSQLEKAFEGVDWDDVVRRRKEADARIGLPDPEFSNTTERPNDENTQPILSSSVPKLKIVNGEIRMDESSLTIDRHAAAAAAQRQELEEIDEDDITRPPVNSQSWIYDNRREPEERRRCTHTPKSWNAESTNEFYDALKMFGTDFDIISRMFPGRTRRHIKSKFVREERLNPDRVRTSLIKERVEIDLSAYCQKTGMEEDFYKDPQVLQEELKEQDKVQTEEIERQKKEQIEAARLKQEAAVARTAAGKGRKGPGAGKVRRKKDIGAPSSSDAAIDSAGLQEGVELAVVDPDVTRVGKETSQSNAGQMEVDGEHSCAESEIVEIIEVAA